MGDFILNLILGKKHHNKRRYLKKEIKDLDALLHTEVKVLEDDPEKSILNVIHTNEEGIIVYRTIFDPDEKFGFFFIDLKVIHRKGIVSERIRLSADYISEDKIEIRDVEVFGDNQGRGYGSILLNELTNFAKKNSVNTIAGWISHVDKDHFDKLDHFYKKHDFEVIWIDDAAEITNNANKAADIIWANPRT